MAKNLSLWQRIMPLLMVNVVYTMEEYQKLSKVWKIILQLDRAGRAKLAPAVEQETQHLIQKNACISNDCHIIALARVSGARLLCSDDVKFTSQDNLQQ